MDWDLIPIEEDGLLIGWRLPGGQVMPVIAGGSDEGDNDEEEEENEEEEELKDPKAAVKAANAKADRFAKKAARLEKKLDDQKTESEAKIAELQKQIEEGSDDSALRDKIKDLEKQSEDKDQTIKDREITLMLMDHDSIAGLSKRKRKLAIKMLLDDVDDDGENIDELVEQLQEEEPDLFESSRSSRNGEEEEEDEEGEEEEGLDAGGVKMRRTAKPPKRKKGSEEYTTRDLESRFPHLVRHR